MQEEAHSALFMKNIYFTTTLNSIFSKRFKYKKMEVTSKYEIDIIKKLPISLPCNQSKTNTSMRAQIYSF